jgi:hypothetical protein
MTRRTGVLLVLLAAIPGAFAQLTDLINKNVTGTTRSYEKLVNKEPVRLWIHVSLPEQDTAVQNLATWIKGINLDGRTVTLKPVQVVKKTPKTSQLRFFFAQDKEEAAQLLSAFKKVFLKLQLVNLSGQYDKLGWLKPGHYELWVASTADNIIAPR